MNSYQKLKARISKLESEQINMLQDIYTIMELGESKGLTHKTFVEIKYKSMFQAEQILWAGTSNTTK